MSFYKITILVPYFGEFPWYFKYFLRSCALNTKIKFIIISNQISFTTTYKNIRWVHFSLEKLNIIISKIFSIESNIINGYKFCDFKPAYGYIFEDLISGCDFWGQSDIDVILGDVRGFLTDELLSKYDYISVRHDFPTGCFSLFRNVNKMNTLFKRSKDYVKVFSESKHYCFDECNNVHDQLTQGVSIFDTNSEIESFMHVLKKAEYDKEIRSYFEFICIEGNTGRIKFDHGKIIYKNKYEAILYHMIRFKKTCKVPKLMDPTPDVYHISPTQFYVK